MFPDVSAVTDENCDISECEFELIASGFITFLFAWSMLFTWQ